MPIFSEGSTFKLILYASFPSDSAALGLDLLRTLQASNPSNFELHLRISSQIRSPHAEGLASTRWDPAFIRKQVLSNVKNLAKVYVCGPPNMTELFERTLGEMIQAKDIRRE
jgi:predicted ferric reductase